MTRAPALAVAAALVALACAPGCAEPAPSSVSATAEADDARFAAGAAAWAKYCALCHGADAHGYVADHAPSLVSSTFLESVSDEFIARAIREGRRDTAMAAYGKMAGGPLTEDDIKAIIAFLRDHGPARVRLPEGPVVGDPARGEEIYETTCKQCHGTRSSPVSAPHLADPRLLAAASDAFLRWAVVHGRPGTPMPSFEGVLSEGEIDDVVAALRSWATTPDPVHRGLPEPPPLWQFVINPGGKNPDFTLREGRFVPIDVVKKALDAKQRMVILDARASSDWYRQHIPGSVSAPYYMLSRLDTMPKDGTWILAYCACPHHASGTVMDELRRRGYTRTAILDEGILEWVRRGYPTESMPVPDAP